MHTRKLSGIVAGLAASVLVLAACGEDEQPPAGGSDSGSEQDMDDAAPVGEFGPACGAVPKSGKGSFDGMAKDPVATAASNNPALSTLVSAVKKAELVDTLNTAENITVFAPTNDAFAAIPEKDLKAVLADKKKLTEILTYHVVGETITPKQLADGDFDTLLQGQSVATSGSGEAYDVNEAKVVCGNVQTANATVYIVDAVLMPPS